MSTLPIIDILPCSDPKQHSVQCFEEYRKGTDLIRENLPVHPKQFLLFYAYPQFLVGTATLARYIKPFLGLAGIDITFLPPTQPERLQLIKLITWVWN